MTDAPGNEPGKDNGKPGEGEPTDEPGAETFTQADVDRMVGKARNDERRKASERFSDYDDLKKKADGAKTLEDRVAEMEASTVKAAQRAQRAEVAAEFGISTKRGEDDTPSDAELFLTGTDDTTLREQAKRFAASRADDTSKSTRVPREGRTPSGKSKSSPWSGVLAELRGGGTTQ